MSINYQINNQRQMVFVLMQGEISTLQLMTFITDVNTEQRDDSYDRLIILKNTRCLLSGTEVAEIAEFAGKLNGSKARHRTAVVVSTECEFGIVRQYQLYRDASPDRFYIFKELSEATAWLGLQDEAALSPMERGVLQASGPLYDGRIAAG